MKSLRRLSAAAITAALLTLGMAGPAAAATAAEYGLLIGLIAV